MLVPARPDSPTAEVVRARPASLEASALGSLRLPVEARTVTTKEVQPRLRRASTSSFVTCRSAGPATTVSHSPLSASTAAPSWPSPSWASPVASPGSVGSVVSRTPLAAFAQLPAGAAPPMPLAKLPGASPRAAAAAGAGASLGFGLAAPAGAAGGSQPGLGRSATALIFPSGLTPLSTRHVTLCSPTATGLATPGGILRKYGLAPGMPYPPGLGFTPAAAALAQRSSFCMGAGTPAAQTAGVLASPCVQVAVFSPQAELSPEEELGEASEVVHSRALLLFLRGGAAETDVAEEAGFLYPRPGWLRAQRAEARAQRDAEREAEQPDQAEKELLKKNLAPLLDEVADDPEPGRAGAAGRSTAALPAQVTQAAAPRGPEATARAVMTAPGQPGPGGHTIQYAHGQPHKQVSHRVQQHPQWHGVGRQTQPGGWWQCSADGKEWTWMVQGAPAPQPQPQKQPQAYFQVGAAAFHNIEAKAGGGPTKGRGRG